MKINLHLLQVTHPILVSEATPTRTTQPNQQIRNSLQVAKMPTPDHLGGKTLQVWQHPLLPSDGCGGAHDDT